MEPGVCTITKHVLSHQQVELHRLLLSPDTNNSKLLTTSKTVAEALLMLYASLNYLVARGRWCWVAKQTVPQAIVKLHKAPGR